MRKPSPHAPYFVIQEGQGELNVSLPLNTFEEVLKAADSGFGVTSYAVGTLAIFDRTQPTVDDFNQAAMQILIELTQNRGGSAPQNLPVALFRRAKRLTDIFLRSGRNP